MDSISASAWTTARPFPDCLRFQKTWRQYQAQILDRLSEYLSDRRIHLVAPPGSGKTILGLEIIRRIGERTLVLAPTITIRDQWVDRLVTYFLPSQQVADWVSVDLKCPAVLTVTTYQALHALCGPANHRSHLEAVDSNEENGEAMTAWQIPEAIGRAGFRTLVVDEAHHLSRYA